MPRYRKKLIKDIPMNEHLWADGDAISLGKYWLFNNLWGAQTGSGSQSIWDVSANDSAIAWGTSWDWTGEPNSVKSYASTVLGWHWGWKLTDTGLPVPLSDHKLIHTSWDYQLNQTNPGKLNVSYDIWLSPNPHLGNENASEEIMIWLARYGDMLPLGSKQTEVILDGITWELWNGSHPEYGWPVYSFVRSPNAIAQALNLTDFFDYLVPSGLSRSFYLISIEAGVEVCTGAGKLDTLSYSVDIR
jgi:Glycosyl hydrolase family 12